MSPHPTPTDSTGMGKSHAPATRSSVRVTRQRALALAAGAKDVQKPVGERTPLATRERGRKTTPASRKRSRAVAATDSDGDVADVSMKSSAGTAVDDDDDEGDADAAALLAQVSAETRTLSAKRKRSGGSGASNKTAIRAEFTSLDALLSSDLAERKRQQQRDDTLKRLREEAKSVGKVGVDVGSPLARLMSAMESNMSSLSADNHLFADDLPRSQEKFGFVFTPITEPLPFAPFKATPAELANRLALVYRAMQTTLEEELGALLWSKAILLRALLEGKRAGLVSAADVASSSPVQPVVLPARVCSWLFLTMSTHSSNHIVKGCLSNLFVLIASSGCQITTELSAGLPSASFAHSFDEFRAIVGGSMPDIQMEWRPTVYDFLNAFRRFGFQDSKRSMSAKSKITSSKTAASGRSSTKPAVPFPMLNMQYVLVFLVLCLRAKLLRLDGYDAFSFTMFFLRMQFEHNMHPEIVQLASVCIEELLEVFPTMEWRKEWAPSLVLRIAGVSEGLFDSATGWLTVARHLPRTKRGTQLTTGLSIYVLQHRIDKSPDDTSNSERPLKFPIQSGLVLDIVAGIVEVMTVTYTEKKHKEGGGGDKARSGPPPFDLLCKKVALMDLALQAFLNELTQKEMAVLLAKLDDLTGSHKSTMSAKWHELKTLVGLMHRKYSLENLRIGRDASPSAKAVLFLDETKEE